MKKSMSEEKKPKPTKMSPIPFRVTDQEKKEITEAAAKVGLTVSAYIRERVLDAPSMRATRRPSVEHEVLAKLLGQIGKVGSNLRELSKEGIKESELLRTVGEVRGVASAIMKALGRRSHDH